jgi:hypothetical protein
LDYFGVRQQLGQNMAVERHGADREPVGALGAQRVPSVPAANGLGQFAAARHENDPSRPWSLVTVHDRFVQPGT